MYSDDDDGSYGSNMSDYQFSDEEGQTNWTPSVQDRMAEEKMKHVRAALYRGQELAQDSPLGSQAVQKLDDITNPEERGAFLEKFYKDNLKKMKDYEKLTKQMVFLLTENQVPGVHVNQEYSPEVLVGFYDTFIKELKQRFTRYQAEFLDANIKSYPFRNAELASMLKTKKDKIFQFMDEQQMEVDRARMEISSLKESIDNLQSELDEYKKMTPEEKVQKAIEEKRLEEREKKWKELDKKEQEIADHEAEEREKQRKKEEEYRKDPTKQNYKRFFRKFKPHPKLFEIEEETADKLAEIARKSELRYRVEEALTAMMKERLSKDEKPNEEDFKEIIQTWLKEMDYALEDTNDAIEEIENRCQKASEQLSRRQSQLQEMTQSSDELNHQIAMLQDSYRLRKIEANRLAESINLLKNQIEIATRHNQELTQFMNQMNQSYKEELNSTFTDSNRSQGRQNTAQVQPVYGTPQQKQHSSARSSPTGNPQRRRPLTESTEFYDSLDESNEYSRSSSQMINRGFRSGDITETSSKNISNPLRKTIYLDSPGRDTPLEVEIGVNPKDVKDTENGEKFECDIVVHMREPQESSQRMGKSQRMYAGRTRYPRLLHGIPIEWAPQDSSTFIHEDGQSYESPRAPPSPRTRNIPSPTSRPYY